MRRVSIYDHEYHRRMAFWSNLRDAPTAMDAETYRERWQIELFLRWFSVYKPFMASVRRLFA